MIQLTVALWITIVGINLDVNTNVFPVNDLKHYGISECWRYPEDGKGDCEDYAIKKKRSLKEIGIQSYFATCWVKGGKQLHAVLLIDTKFYGTLVLDNRSRLIKQWKQTDYKWDKRMQKDGNWYSIKD